MRGILRGASSPRASPPTECKSIVAKHARSEPQQDDAQGPLARNGIHKSFTPPARLVAAGRHLGIPKTMLEALLSVHNPRSQLRFFCIAQLGKTRLRLHVQYICSCKTQDEWPKVHAPINDASFAVLRSDPTFSRA